MARAASRRGVQLARGRGLDGRGLILSRCRLETATAWGRRGLGPMVVAPLGQWTGIVPVGPVRARYPYDDAIRTLAGRPVGVWMRPALGFFQVGRQAVVTVHPDGWHAVQRWMIWTPREGSVPPAGLAAARPSDIVAAAGTHTGREASECARDLRDVLADGTVYAQEVLAAVLARLDLPGAELLSGELDPFDAPGAREIRPHPRHARAFDRFLSEAERTRIEEEN